jgi:hypothetical protein
LELRVHHLKARAVGTTRFEGKQRTRAFVFMTPEDLLRFYSRLQIKEDNRFEEISEQKEYLLRKWGACVDTVYLKNRSKRTGEVIGSNPELE